MFTYPRTHHGLRHRLVYVETFTGSGVLIYSCMTSLHFTSLRLDPKRREKTFRREVRCGYRLVIHMQTLRGKWAFPGGILSLAGPALGIHSDLDGIARLPNQGSETEKQREGETRTLRLDTRHRGR